MYLSYEEYQNMGGTVDETTFLDLEFEAECLINWHTFNRLGNDTVISEGVKRCMYKLIELGYLKQQSLTVGQDVNGNSTGAIASQSNDGFSTEFNVLKAQTAFELAKAEVTTTINKYLANEVNEAGRKLLYRGYYPYE